MHIRIDFSIIIIHFIVLIFLIGGSFMEKWCQKNYCYFESKHLKMYYGNKGRENLKRPLIYLVIWLYSFLLLSTVLFITKIKSSSLFTYIIIQNSELGKFLKYNMPFLCIISIIIYCSYFFEYYYLVSKNKFYYMKFFILSCLNFIHYLLFIKQIKSIYVASYILYIFWFFCIMRAFFKEKQNFSNINFLWQFIWILWNICLIISTLFYLCSGGIR